MSYYLNSCNLSLPHCPWLSMKIPFKLKWGHFIVSKLCKTLLFWGCVTPPALRTILMQLFIVFFNEFHERKKKIWGMICLLALEDAIMTFYPQQISRSNTSPKYLHWFSIIRKRYLASFVITATPPYATSAQRLQCLCNKLSTSLHSRLKYVEEFFNRFLGLQGTLPDVMPLVLKLTGEGHWTLSRGAEMP